MPVRDTPAGYGIVSRLFHWLMALAIFGLFALGWWMVGLDYYSPYYHQRAGSPSRRRHCAAHRAARAHRLARVNIKPDDAELTPLERKAAHLVHWAFYPLLMALMISGYLISTPDGRPIDVFGLFSGAVDRAAKGLGGYRRASFIGCWPIR